MTRLRDRRPGAAHLDLAWRLEELPVPGDARSLFARPEAPLHLDLGCGAGGFLAALAARQPECNFLGVDRLFGRIRSAAFKAKSAHPDNVRLLQADVRAFLRENLPRHSVSAVYLLFPDPWPKRHHHIRRLFQAELLEICSILLMPCAPIYLATDHADYFRHMCATSHAKPGTNVGPWPDPDSWPRTEFEARFLQQGLPVHRLRITMDAPLMNPVARMESASEASVIAPCVSCSQTETPDARS